MTIVTDFKKVNSYIVAGEGNRCFTCGAKCNEDALVLTEHNQIDNEDIYFCGNCVYHNTAIGRPCNNWRSKKEIDDEEARKRRKAAKEKREHEKWLKQFCCKTFRELMHRETGYTSIGYKGTVSLITINRHYYDDDIDDLEYENHNNMFDFKFCPYCKKKFIREKVKK